MEGCEAVLALCLSNPVKHRCNAWRTRRFAFSLFSKKVWSSSYSGLFINGFCPRSCVFLFVSLVFLMAFCGRTDFSCCVEERKIQFLRKREGRGRPNNQTQKLRAREGKIRVFILPAAETLLTLSAPMSRGVCTVRSSADRLRHQTKTFASVYSPMYLPVPVYLNADLSER